MFAYEVGDPQGRLLFVNERFLDMWDMPRDDGADADPCRRDGGRAASCSSIRQREEQRIADILARDETHVDRLELRDGRMLERRSVPLQDAAGTRPGSGPYVTSRCRNRRSQRCAPATGSSAR